MSHIYWIGGSPCSGKSSIARILSERYGLRIYDCDSMYEAHLKRAVPGKHPHLTRAAEISWDEVWMHPVDYLTEREFAFYREEFELIREDLIAMPQDTPICAEGAALLPELLAAMKISPQKAIWIMPTEEFQRREYARRDWVQGILAQCSQPDEAWESWMGRDAQYARVVARQAERLGYAVLKVDESRSIEENAIRSRSILDWDANRHQRGRVAPRKPTSRR